jgi:hypothetical protein
VTFKDLQKLVQSKSGPEQSQLLQRLRNKEFWIWDQSQHRQEDIKTKGDCCLNHIIGLPTKDKEEKPMFDYEKLLYDTLLTSDVYNPLNHNFKHKHLWVKKATGLGFPITSKFTGVKRWFFICCQLLNFFFYSFNSCHCFKSGLCLNHRIIFIPTKHPNTMI